jgi:hypothetical protein
MEFRTIENDQEALRVFPVLKELRDQLDEQSFLKLLALAKAESGYKLIGAYEGPECLGLMGFRILTDFTGCPRLRLCTGIQNEKGKAFYERNGWNLRAVAYKTQI